MSARHIWHPVQDAILMDYVQRGQPVGEAATLIGVTYQAAQARYYRISGRANIRSTPRLEWTEQQVETLRTMVAAGHTDGEIGRCLGVSRSSVERARMRRNIVRAPRSLPVPAGFAEYAVDHTRTECAHHFDVSTGAVTRWCMAAKVDPKRYVAPQPAQPVGNTPAQGSWRSPPAPQRDGGPVGDAMLLLQQAGMAVYRLRVIKETAPADMWVVGTRKMHEAEMLALAKTRYGLQVAA